MSDAQAQVDALARSVANLDSKVSTVLPKIGQLITPTGGGTGGSGNMLNNALAGFTSSASNAGSIGQIIGGFASMGAAAVTYGTMAMPDVTSTISRSAAFYQTSLTAPGTNKGAVSQATFNAMKGGISSPGSDAAVARGLTSRGIAFSADPNSTYMQMTRNISNSAQYLGQDNATAMNAIAGLTSGQGSANLMATMGIYTSDMSGKTRTESAIFGDIAAQLTAGQGKMSSQEVMDSFYKGSLGASLNNMGLDQDQQQRFLQFMVNRSGGKGMDLSNNSAAKKLIGNNNKLNNSNPIQATLDINTTMTDQMQSASAPYEQGMKDAAGLFQSMNGSVKDLIANFGVLNAQVQTFTATPAGAATVTAASQAASGLTSIIGGIFGLVPKGLPIGGPPSGNSLGTSSDSGNTSSMRATSAPTNGSITAIFGQKGEMWSSGSHRGTDFGVPDGSPIYAVADGKVSNDSVGSGSNSYGHYIQLDHGNGYETLYAHLDPSSADVHPGDEVTAGQLIGRSGHSGHVTGPHLHFEVRKDKTSVDPSAFLAGAVDIAPPSGNSTTKTAKAALSSKKGSTSASINSVFTTSASGFDASLQSAASLLGTSATTTGLLGTLSSGVSGRVSSWSGTSTASGNTASYSGPPTDIGGSSNGNAMGSITPGSFRNSGGGAAANIEINVHVASASEQEARKFASLVKQVLEEDRLTMNMGSY